MRNLWFSNPVVLQVTMRFSGLASCVRVAAKSVLLQEKVQVRVSSAGISENFVMVRRADWADSRSAM